MTLRVYQTEPQRAALLAKVVAAGPDWFAADRTILHAAARAYGHDMPPDRGEVHGGGHKSKITRSRLGRDGDVLHVVSGPVPPVGTDVRIHLDEHRRALSTRAHALAHLLAVAVVARRGELLEFPLTTGGGQARVAARLRGGEAEAALILADLNARIARGARPVAEWVPRADADRRTLAGAVIPADDVVRLVAYGGAWLPCDAPVVKDLREIGGVRFAQPPRERAGAVQLVVRGG